MRTALTGLILAACMVICGIVYQYSQSVAGRKAATKAPERLAVQVMRVQRRTLRERTDLVGSLAANATVTIRAKTGGYVVKLPFDVGDVVKEGQLIVELDQTRHHELVSRAEAALKVAKAQLLAQETRQAQAAKELERQTQLAKSRVTTAEQQEAAAAQLAIANAELDLEQARVDQAESDLQRTRLAMDETRVLSPLSGFVATRLVDQGDLADPNKDLLQIVDLTKVRTVVHVVEKDYEKVKLDQTATIRVDAFPDEEFSGRVIRKAPVLDNQTRTAAVQIEIPNPKALLKPGMHARVSIVFGVHSEADVVPLASLVEHGDKPALFVVEGDPPTSVLHEVETGLSEGDMVEIVSGLHPEDMVVTLGTRLIQHGQQVTPVETPAVSSLDEAKPERDGAE